MKRRGVKLKPILKRNGLGGFLLSRVRIVGDNREGTKSNRDGSL